MKKDYLIIDRAKWRTGGISYLNLNYTGEGSTLLLNEEGFMCCLGFRCHQMGVPEEDLLGSPTPDSLSELYDIPDLIEKVGLFCDFSVYRDTRFTQDAVNINDNTGLSSKEREKAITKHFKKIGVTVEFKGRYKKSKV